MKTITDRVEFLSALFIGLVLLANLLGTKITAIGSIEFSVALFAFPFTFLITDLITEVKGKAYARRIVHNACYVLIVALLFQALFVALPFADRSFVQEEYTAVFGAGVRILIASIVAFTLSQTHDVWAFDLWRKRTHNKHLWLRNNLSTIVSQAIDSVVFMFVAFLYIPFLPRIINTAEHFTPLYVLRLAAPYYLLKVVMALIDTPLIYIGTRWLRGGSAGAPHRNRRAADS